MAASVATSPTPSKPGFTTPYAFPRKYSTLTKPRWICFALFLFFAIPAVGLAIDNYQRTTRNGPPGLGDPPPIPDIVVVWRNVPIIELSLTSTAVTLPWLLDIWYPLTFMSKPIGEVGYFLIVLAIHVGTIGFTVNTLPPIVEWLSRQNSPMPDQAVSREAWAMVVCMAIQIIILVVLCIIITWSTVQYIRNGRSDALHHPTCRFDPNAAPPTVLLGIHHQSMQRIPQPSYIAMNNASVIELGQLPPYSYPTKPASQESGQEGRSDHPHFTQGH